MQGCDALTEKEKQTLRLLLAGHDAKSMARHLGLSVHTINERLRNSRRKLSVSSSKEAARLLREREAAGPQMLGGTPFGDGAASATAHRSGRPAEAPPARRRAGWAIGGLAMTFLLAASLTLLTPAAPPQAGVETAAAETPVTKAARDWLALLDAGKWSESYAATTPSFRSLNTVDAWRAASEKVRAPLGRTLSRTLLSEQDTPAPPNGYRTVRFRTDFANKAAVTETLSLDLEGNAWRVVGIYIE